MRTDEIRVVLLDPTEPVVHRGQWYDRGSLRIACADWLRYPGDWAEASPGTAATCLWCVAKGLRWPGSRRAGR